MATGVADARRLSSALKEFHRALLRAEIGDDPELANPYSQLFALIGDPRFAWMGAVSRLIVRLDAFADDPEAEGGETIGGLRREVEALLAEEGDDGLEDFRLRRLMAVQRDPGVGLATGRLRAALATR